MVLKLIITFIQHEILKIHPVWVNIFVADSSILQICHINCYDFVKGFKEDRYNVDLNKVHVKKYLIAIILTLFPKLISLRGMGG